ncbi:MAG: PaaI family thioesterase [Actinomycetota bacterium]
MQTEPVVYEHPVRGGLGDPSILGLNGLDRMRLALERKWVPPPTYHLTGLQPTQVGEGTATFTMPATRWWQSAAGVFLGGTLAFLADAPLGCAVITALGPGKVLATSELSMNYLRPATISSGLLTGHSRVAHIGRSLGLSDVRIEDSRGQTLALGSSRLFIIDLGDIDPPPDVTAVYEPPTFATPDPYLRDAPGDLIPGEDIASISGLEFWNNFLQGQWQPPPLYYLTGFQPQEVSEGAMTFTMPASGWMMSPAAIIYGGATAMFADMALTGVVATIAPAGTAYATLDLKVHFLRRVQTDGRILTARARVIHHGRSFAVSTVEIIDADGKRVATATGSSMLLPGRMLDLTHPVIPEEEAAQE